MITERQTKILNKSIDKFNADLEAYFEANGERDLPLIDCTVIGYAPAYLYEVKVNKTSVKVTDCDGMEYTVKTEADLDEVKEAIKYDRRRLAKAWRVFKSDNPDWELEHDTEDED